MTMSYLKRTSQGPYKLEDASSMDNYHLISIYDMLKGRNLVEAGNELINKINEEKIPVVFYTDISDIITAERIANLTKTKALELHSAHNIAINDFDKGITHIDIMKKNIKALEEALK